MKRVIVYEQATPGYGKPRVTCCKLSIENSAKAGSLSQTLLVEPKVFRIFFQERILGNVIKSW